MGKRLLVQFGRGPGWKPRFGKCRLPPYLKGASWAMSTVWLPRAEATIIEAQDVVAGPIAPSPRERCGREENVTEEQPGAAGPTTPPDSRGWMREVLTPQETGQSFDRDCWPGPEAMVASENPLWRQYSVLVDLYKYYLDVAWKVSVWYYATTGAALTYFFANVGKEGTHALPWVLGFFDAASLGFAYLHWRGSRHLYDLMKLLEDIATKLKLPGRPHVEFGAAFVLINAFLLVGVSLALTTLLVIKPWSG